MAGLNIKGLNFIPIYFYKPFFFLKLISLTVINRKWMLYRIYTVCLFYGACMMSAAECIVTFPKQGKHYKYLQPRFNSLEGRISISHQNYNSKIFILFFDMWSFIVSHSEWIWSCSKAHHLFRLISLTCWVGRCPIFGITYNLRIVLVVEINILLLLSSFYVFWGILFIFSRWTKF